jgi:hypothetical protein
MNPVATPDQRRRIGAARWSLLPVVWLAALAMAAEPADHLFIGEHILTMAAGSETAAEPPGAVAIRGETIVWVGGADSASDWVGPAFLGQPGPATGGPGDRFREPHADTQ